MPNRNFSSSNYRFGFNGQEKVDEIAGAGNRYTAEFWEYDALTGKRGNPDPVVKPHESPYAAFANNPICFVDIAGNDTSTVYSGGSANSYFTNTVGKQGDKHTVFGNPYWDEGGDIHYSEKVAKIYHAGSDYGAAGWYSEDEYEDINLDWEHGQVMPPMQAWEKFPVYTEGARNWNGWGVGSDGYLTGEPSTIELGVAFGGGLGSKGKALTNGLRLLGGSGNRTGLYTIYQGIKEFNGQYLLYIGKAKNGIKARYTAAEINDFDVRAFKLLNNIPNNGIALGVEQAIMELNGWGREGGECYKAHIV